MFLFLEGRFALKHLSIISAVCCFTVFTTLLWFKAFDTEHQRFSLGEGCVTEMRNMLQFHGLSPSYTEGVLCFGAPMRQYARGVVSVACYHMYVLLVVIVF